VKRGDEGAERHTLNAPKHPLIRPSATFSPRGEEDRTISTSRLCKAGEKFVAFLLDRVEGVLDGDFAREDAAVFAFHDFADLRVEAEAVALRPFTGRQHQLLDADFGGRLLGVVAFLLGKLVGCLGDGDVTGSLVIENLDFRRGQELEEVGNALVFCFRLAGIANRAAPPMKDEVPAPLIEPQYGRKVAENGICAVFCRPPNEPDEPIQRAALFSSNIYWLSFQPAP
jgi:hypothetical protein